MKKTKQTSAANMPAEIVHELERNHLKANEHNRQKLQELAESLGENWETVKNCHIEPTAKNGGGFFVWLMKISEYQAGKPWGTQYDYINNPADFVEGLEEMNPREWIKNQLNTITAKEWKEGAARPVFTVEKLENNRPQTLADYMNNRPALRVWFVYIHKNEHADGNKWREVVGTFDPETKQDQGGNLCPRYFQSVTKYTNRKHCAQVYAISTPKAPAEEVKAKKEQRQANRPAFTYWRYKNIKIETSSNGAGKLRIEQITADQLGGAAGSYIRPRSWGGVCWSSEWHYNNAEEIRAELVDKSGNIIQLLKRELNHRARVLKTQRQEERAKVYEFAPEIEILKGRADMLRALLVKMTAEYCENRAGESWGAFYYSHLLRRVADCLEDVRQIADKCSGKKWRNIGDFINEEEKNKKRAENIAVVVAEWLNLKPEQRGHDGQEERAIYYGCYSIDAGRVVYDFAALAGRP